jgi:hypothetical protein
MGFVNLRWYKNPFAQPNNPAIGLKNGKKADFAKKRKYR